VDFNGHLPTAKLSLKQNGEAISIPADVTIECRTFPIGGNASFSPCTLDSNQQFELAFDMAKPVGRYQTEARITFQGMTSDAASVTYYVHKALDNAEICHQTVNQNDYFTAAAAVLPQEATFGSETLLNAPFNTIKFDNSANFGNKLVKVASLRKRFVRSSDNKMMLLYRDMASGMWGGCNKGLQGWQRGMHVYESYDAVVFDAKGNWVGFKNHTATVAGSGSNASRRFVGANWNAVSYGTHKPFQTYSIDTYWADKNELGINFIIDE
jgi:hypothetical protein